MASIIAEDFDLSRKLIVSTKDISKESKTPNGVVIYSLFSKAKQLGEVIEKFLRIFQDIRDVVDLLKDEWMEISLVKDWENLAAKLIHKVYPLNNRLKALINQKFDKMHQERKIS